MQTNAINPSTLNISPPGRNQQLQALAGKLEAQFLAVMLKESGIGKTPQSFGGGAGEDHFSSFLTQEYAAAIVDAGGLGLSEVIYNSLVKLENGV